MENNKIISIQRLGQEKQLREYDGIIPTIQTPSGGGHLPYILSENSIRRITPTECERLQGFPDNWTAKGNFDGEIKEISDTQRYKLCGNGVVVNCVEYIISNLAINNLMR